MQLVRIGTMVVASDGMTTPRLGQVADHVVDRWGEWHLVQVGGKFETVGHVGQADHQGIGWRVATDDDVQRYGKKGRRSKR